MQFKRSFFVSALLLATCLGIYLYSTIPGQVSDRKKYEAYLEQLHESFLKRHQLIHHGEETDGPELSWEQQFLLTLDPATGKPAPERLIPVMAQLHQNEFNKGPGSPGTPWEERGPDNIGGRIRALVWDPNDSTHRKVWAGSVSGGLWYNNDITDSMSAWIKVNDFWDNISIGCLMFDPNNSLVAYAGTGEGWNIGAGASRGAGIWKTTDGGNTWNRLASTSDFFYLNDILIRNENDTSVIYAAVDGTGHLNPSGTSIDYEGGAYSGLQRSVDGGLTWKQVLPLIPGKSMNYVAADLKLDSANRLWIGSRAFPDSLGAGGGKIFYSDDGISWTLSNSTNVSARSGRVQVACAPSDLNVLYTLVESG